MRSACRPGRPPIRRTRTRGTSAAVPRRTGSGIALGRPFARLSGATIVAIAVRAVPRFHAFEIVDARLRRFAEAADTGLRAVEACPQRIAGLGVDPRVRLSGVRAGVRGHRSVHRCVGADVSVLGRPRFGTAGRKVEGREQSQGGCRAIHQNTRCGSQEKWATRRVALRGVVSRSTSSSAHRLAPRFAAIACLKGGVSGWKSRVSGLAALVPIWSFRCRSKTFRFGAGSSRARAGSSRFRAGSSLGLPVPPAPHGAPLQIRAGSVRDAPEAPRAEPEAPRREPEAPRGEPEAPGSDPGAPSFEPPSSAAAPEALGAETEAQVFAFTTESGVVPPAAVQLGSLSPARSRRSASPRRIRWSRRLITTRATVAHSSCHSRRATSASR